MRNRIEEIRTKGFNIVQGRTDIDYQQLSTGYQNPNIDYAKIRMGAKMLDDAILGTVVASAGETKLSFVNNIERQRLVFSYSPGDGDEGYAIIGGFARSRLSGLVFSVR